MKTTTFTDVREASEEERVAVDALKDVAGDESQAAADRVAAARTLLAYEGRI